jgi:hypothetical protein
MPYIFPCRPDENKCDHLADECTCSKRQQSDHCSFVTALDITYKGEDRLFVSLAEATSSTFVRSEVLHHGRTHLRISRRKYLYRGAYQHTNNKGFQSGEMGIKTFRVLELIFGDDVSLLAKTLSHLAVQVRLVHCPGGQDDLLRSAFYRYIHKAVNFWLDHCNRQKKILTQLIDHKFTALDNQDAYQSCLMGKTIETTYKGENVLQRSLDDVRDEMLKDEEIKGVSGYECMIDKFFWQPLLTGERLVDLIRNAWDEQLKLLFSTSVRCQPLYYDNNGWQPLFHTRPLTVEDDGFVGFIDFRPRAGFAPIAMALLKPPLQFNIQSIGRGTIPYNRQDFTIICGDYTEPFGMAHDRQPQDRLKYSPTEPNIERGVWERSFYAMHDSEKESGSRCAHVCIIMACGLLSNSWMLTRPDIARIPGTFEVSYLAALICHSVALSATTDAVPLSCAPAGSDAWEFDPTQGLTPDCVTTVLKNECGVNAFFRRRDNDEVSVYVLERLLEAYISADFPVIIFCNVEGLYEPDSLYCQHYTGRSEAAHCVLVNGFRRRLQGEPENFQDETGNKLTHVVIHDPGCAPFLAIPTRRLFDAATKYEKENRFNFVAITRKSIAISADDCFNTFLNMCNGKHFQEYIFLNNPPKEKTRINPLDIQKEGWEIEIALMKDANTLNEEVLSSPETFVFPELTNEGIDMDAYLEQIRGYVLQTIKSPVWIVRLLDSHGHTVCVCLFAKCPVPRFAAGGHCASSLQHH